MIFKKILLFSFVVSVALPQTSYSNDYTFGSCTSKGGWTQTALTQTASIATLITQLKDLPACKGIESLKSNLDQLQNLRSPTTEAAQRLRIESLPSELAALRQYRTSDPSTKDIVSKLILDKSLESATMSTAQNQNFSSIDPKLMMMSDRLSSLSSRFNSSVDIATESLSRYFSTVSNYSGCLMARPDLGVQLITASVDLIGAFAGGGSALSKLGKPLEGFLRMLQTSNLRNALRKANETAFLSSIACLMESTSDLYCSIEDAYHLSNSNVSTNTENIELKLKNKTGSNPIEGYFLITRELPAISNWIQAIISGATPNFETDAQQKNKIWNGIMEFIKSTNTLKSMVNESYIQTQALTDINQKRNAVYKLIFRISDTIIGDQGSSTTNYYTIEAVPQYMPFYLIGLKDIPEPCIRRPNDPVNKVLNSPQDWMLSGGSYVPQFQDPEALFQVIRAQIDGLIARAQTAASAQFQQRMVLDMQNLCAQGVTNEVVTVEQSFINVASYLNRLEDRIWKAQGHEFGNIQMIPLIRDTQKRLSTILEKFNTYKKISRSYQYKKTSADLLDSSKKSCEAIVNAAYTQLNVMLQLNTFLTNRLTTLIRHDYIMRVRNHESMSPYEQELLTVSGAALLERLSEVNRVDANRIKLDLDGAQVAAQTNLGLLQQSFSNVLAPMIEELGMVASNSKPTNVKINFKRLGRFFEDIGPAGPAAPFIIFNQWMQYRERYTLKPWFAPYTKQGADTSNNSNAQYKARICILTLGFENRESFYHLCAGSVLKSAYSIVNKPQDRKMKTSELDVSYDEYFKKSRASVTSAYAEGYKNICAFRDFDRKNQRHYLIQNQINAEKKRAEVFSAIEVQ